MNREDCLICGAEIVYTQRMEDMVCSGCGKELRSNARCAEGHFVCDECHGNPARARVIAVATASESTDPVEIMDLLMDLPETNMHGPEHHALVPVSLLVAFRNAGMELPSLEERLHEALDRGARVPGGICGFWGSCGASIGGGIAVSVAYDCSPLKAEHYGDVNRVTARSLNHIADIGGPRCCKRNSYISLTETAQYARDVLDIPLTVAEDIICHHQARNKECIHQECPYFN